jgi:hypothetical protein
MLLHVVAETWDHGRAPVDAYRLRVRRPSLDYTKHSSYRQLGGLSEKWGVSSEVAKRSLRRTPGAAVRSTIGNPTSIHSSWSSKHNWQRHLVRLRHHDRAILHNGH